MSFTKISLVNNDATAMEDVVHGLQYAFGFSQRDAVDAMVRVHKGSVEMVALCRDEDSPFFQARLEEVNRAINTPFEVQFAPIVPGEGVDPLSPDMVSDQTFEAFKQAETETAKRSNFLMLLLLLTLVAIVVVVLFG